MSRKSSVEDALESDQADRSPNSSSSGSNKVEAGQRNGETASSSPESGSLNGDGKRGGKSRRRKKRSSKSENQAEVKAEAENKEKRDQDRAAALSGLWSENIWFERSAYERAESRYHCWLLGSQSVPNSPDLPSASRPAPSRTPDEGYRSLTPTPGSRQAANGLPCVPAELLRDVWLEKPQYDRAEAAFYQNLYGNNSSKRPGRTAEHPQSLKEEEEEDEEEAAVVEEKRVVLPGKAEVFHALHPIQEEEEPPETPEGEETTATFFFLHPDSERVWMDKRRYDAAESRFYGNAAAKTPAAKKDRRREASKNTRSREKKMSLTDFLAEEKIWFDKPRFDEAERRFYERMNGSPQSAQDVGANSILQDIARARENIQKSLAGLKSALCNRDSAPAFLNPSNNGNNAGDQGEVMCRIKNLEQENQSLHKVVDGLRAALSKLESRVAVLEKSPAAVLPAVCTNGTSVQNNGAPVKSQEDDEDDDIDLFGSDEDEEAEKLKEQRLKEYAERKAKKPAIIAKSSILLDVKPWDDETDMAKLEECVRSVQADGLLWGTSKLVPVGYGIKKLQIACVVEDDKVGTDLLEEEITKFEDFVQSVDVAAFNKI